MTGKEICDTIRKAHPLEHDFQSDARYIWPSRWEELPNAIDTAIAQAVAAERNRCATILREHICNYCDHDHAEDMAQLVEKSNAK